MEGMYLLLASLLTWHPKQLLGCIWKSILLFQKAIAHAEENTLQCNIFSWAQWWTPISSAMATLQLAVLQCCNIRENQLYAAVLHVVWEWLAAICNTIACSLLQQLPAMYCAQLSNGKHVHLTEYAVHCSSIVHTVVHTVLRTWAIQAQSCHQKIYWSLGM